MVYHKSTSYPAGTINLYWNGMYTACSRFLEYPVENIRRSWKHVTCKSCLKKKRN